MQKIMIFISLLLSMSGCSQKGVKKDLTLWQNAVVNLETESFLNPKFIIDSILESKTKVLNVIQYEELQRQLQVTRVSTGTALYVSYKDRRYLVTAKHVLFDEVMASQKVREKQIGLRDWKSFDAIAPRVSVRTPFMFFNKRKEINTYAVYNNNFALDEMPYFLISDSTGDGIGVLSLQEKNYKMLDTVLQKNGFIPIALEKVCCNEDVQVLDDIYVIGYPEMVSIVGKVNLKPGLNSPQSTDIVSSFIVKGTVSMYEPNIQHYYVDLTITPGNSGSPVIKDGKLVGIVSAINKYHIIQENLPSGQNPNLYGIGHLVNVINTKLLINELEKYQIREEQIIQKQKAD